MSNSVAAPSPADQGGGPPPLPHRRPRVREVSSRFMSPSPSISSAGDLHSVTLKSPKHSISTKPSPSHRRLLLRPQTPQPEAFCSSSQDNIIPPTVRSSETPFHYAKGETQRRQRKLFKENGFGEQGQGQSQNPKPSTLRSSMSKRQDTPSDRIVPSRFRLPNRQSTHTSSSVTDAAKLLQSINDSEGCQSESESVQGGSCPNSPISSHSRSSVADDNTLSTRPLVRSSSSASCQSSTSSSSLSVSSSSLSSATPSLCTRSLNSFKSIDRGLCKPSPGISVSTEFRALPPQPTGAKVGGELRKVKKPQSAQQDIHSLKMLHNHHLLWRFSNAKAQASMQAQRTEMEKQFFSVGSDISQLRDKVKKKQAELAILQREKALSTILESQMPYLDDWSALEDDYTNSLSGVTTALTNSLLRLPISGNVQVNVKEVAEALDSAVKTADMIANQMQLFMPKTEEMDSLMSELASVVDVEKALVEECGNLLVKTHTLQVEDCSLRGHLMQVGASS
ncbi:protein ENDOSPERM DEFECTIVE 1-like [Bidens hawaiensis]|uniref:protein ENDOSPERM DEFECTIVE 1-like n=1 Tax=Bidens hawaiensis TaxID=980011 RepID=UPI00404B0269